MAELEAGPQQADSLAKAGAASAPASKRARPMSEGPEDAAEESGIRHELNQVHNKYLQEISARLEAKYEKEKVVLENNLKAQHAADISALNETHKASADKADAQHKAAQAEWETMLARRKRDSKLFTFTVQGCEGPGLSGCLPRQIFDAEPNSALAHIYNGDWQYSTDDKGRAVINSDPAHWPIIIRWLSFGTVPAAPTPELISECQYWQLDRLLEAIKANAASTSQQKPCNFTVSSVKSDDSWGFRAEANIPCFLEELEKAASTKTFAAHSFNAVGRGWTLSLHQTEIRMTMDSGPPLTTAGTITFLWGRSPNHMKNKCSLDQAFLKGESFAWDITPEELEQLMHPKLLLADGSMPLTITIYFRLLGQAQAATQ